MNVSRALRPRCTAIALLGALTAQRGWCSQVSAQIYVPSKVQMINLPWPAANPVVQLWTVDGEPMSLQIQSTDGGVLSGQRLGSSAQAIQVPLDQVAVVYYTDAPLASFKNQPVSLRIERLPKVGAVGKAEEALGCEALDVELKRAETLHGLARQSGAMPLTTEERRSTHEREATAAVGALLLWPITLSYGAGAAVNAGIDRLVAGPAPDKPPHFGEDPWALTRIDERLEGLLRLKTAGKCAASPTTSEHRTDLDLWKDYQSWATVLPADSSGESMARDRRTLVFDRLGPKAVEPTHSIDAAVPDAVVLAYWKDLKWYAGVDALQSVAHFKGFPRSQVGILILTDHGLVAHFDARHESQSRQSDESVEGVRISYGDIAAVETGSHGFGKELIIRRHDGQLDSCQLESNHVTSAVGAIINAQLTAWRKSRETGS